ncbi:hypothetical protein CesoFtcFv8_021635 [Champsocephalus esox]|uniref:Uncharacterized protein n=1 Tax=Champsocephalus esox TaxID=159716 RepID=A0AAN8B9V3_9TELE|nr:hypothetical protein CesoFtcFv8_021635 [Champsocephalus esox]
MRKESPVITVSQQWMTFVSTGRRARREQLTFLSLAVWSRVRYVTCVRPFSMISRLIGMLATPSDRLYVYAGCRKEKMLEAEEEEEILSTNDPQKGSIGRV